MRVKLGVVLAVALVGASVFASNAFAVTNTLSQEFGVRLIKQPPGQPWAIGLNMHSVMDANDRQKSRRAEHPLLLPAREGQRQVLQDLRCREAGGRGAVGVSVGVEARDRDVAGGRAAAGEPGARDDHDVQRQAEQREPGVPVLRVGDRGLGQPRDQGRAGGVGKFGYTLDVSIPKIPTLPGQADASIHDIDVDVAATTRSKGRTVYLLQAPTSCPSGGFPFQATYSFADDQRLTTSSAVSCTLSTKSTA